MSLDFATTVSLVIQHPVSNIRPKNSISNGFPAHPVEKVSANVSIEVNVARSGDIVKQGFRKEVGN